MIELIPALIKIAVLIMILAIVSWAVIASGVLIAAYCVLG